MDFQQARTTILRHGSGLLRDEDNPDALDDGGFLGMLRPYRGLNEDNFHTVMEALFVVGDTLHHSETVDRDLIESLWSTAYLMRCWGLDAGGMLQRNNLITEADTNRLARWVSIFEHCALAMLRGCPSHLNAETYAQYIIDTGAGRNIAAFIPYLHRCLDESTDPSLVAEALGKLGPAALETLPSLHTAANREYPDWCRDDAAIAIQHAIALLERYVA